MSHKGNGWDSGRVNVQRIETELFADHVPENVRAADHALFKYIESFYNRRRLHSTLDYITPYE